MDVRIWTRSDRTGGAIDDVLDRLRDERPRIVVQRLVGTFTGDDDNVYWVRDEAREEDVQIDTNIDGGPPFLIEGNFAPRQKVEVIDVDRIVRVIGEALDGGGR